MTTRLAVSVVIPVRNEERNLPRCLAAVSSFAEVIVVDSGSTDRTRSIAEAAGANVINFVWDGRYPKKRNWVLLNHEPSQPWVLFLDADEIVDEAFCNALAATLPGTTHTGFWLTYTNYFLGKRLRYGVAQRKLALFRVGAGLYERIEEDAWSGLDMEIHEHPILEGTIGTIDAPIEHNDDRGILKFIDRHREYAAWEAARLKMLRGAAPGATAHLTERQRTKYRYLDRWWYASAYFVGQFVVKLGFLDGFAGLQYALGKFWYFNTIYLLTRGDRQHVPEAKPKASTPLGDGERLRR